MQPNWFVAFPVEVPWLDELPSLPSGFRKFAPEDVHLTLYFLGACGEAVARRGFEAVGRALASGGNSALAVSFGQVVPMGAAARYSALSATLEQGNDVVTKWLTELRDVCADAVGLPRDRRPALPHVTLARPQRRASEEERDGGLRWARSVYLANKSSVLDRVALYTWNAQRDVRLFQVVEQAWLGSLLGRG